MAREGETKEVAVVGASTSGLFTALLLAQEGLPVRVLERSEELDPAPRTLIVTAKMRKHLRGFGETSVVNEIDRFELFANGRVATVPLKKPDLVIERSALIRELAKETANAGGQLLLGTRFTGFSNTGQGLDLGVQAGKDEDRFQVKALVGADGASSSVAQSAGWSRQPTVPLVQAIVDLPKGMAPNVSRVWFRPDDTPYFYWLVPESPTRGALGVIGAKDGATTRKRLDNFLEGQHLEPLEYQAARIPVYRGWTRTHTRVGNGDVYLVGDAAGQVKVSTVGGIVTGLRGAEGVAEAILGGGGQPKLKSLQLELGLHLMVRKALHNFSQEDYVGLLDLLGPRTQHVLSEHTRDETAKIFWRLALAEPRLLLLAMRGMITRSW